MKYERYIPLGGLYDYQASNVRYNSGERQSEQPERRSYAGYDRRSSRYVETDPIVDTYFDLDRYYGISTRQASRELSDQRSRQNAVSEESRQRPGASEYNARPKTSDRRTQTQESGSSRSWRTTREYALENAASRQGVRSQRENETTRSCRRAASPDTERFLQYKRSLDRTTCEPRDGAYHTATYEGSRDASSR